jgi:hypothetical protein
MAILNRAPHILLAGVLSLAGAGAAAAAQPIDEYQLKAAFLYNFAKFVEWPAGAFKAPADPILICVSEESPILGPLEETVKGKAVGERSVVVQRGFGGGRCHIVFIGAGCKRPGVTEELKTGGSLTVGETDGFTTDGGMVALKRDNGRIRVEVNIDAAERAKVHISSKLLSLATVVHK